MTADDPLTPRLGPASIALVVAVVAGSGVLWLARAYDISTGLPCDARGTWGCTIDGPQFFVIGLVAGGIVVGVTVVLAVLARLWSGLLAKGVLVAGALGWAVLFTLLLLGAQFRP